MKTRPVLIAGSYCMDRRFGPQIAQQRVTLLGQFPQPLPLTAGVFLPNQLRPVNKTTLTWDQLRLLLASVSLRDRILLTLDMTETFRPSELFALRGGGFEMDARTLTVRQTAYRGKLRDYGKTKKVAADGARARGPGERAVALEARVPGRVS